MVEGPGRVGFGTCAPDGPDGPDVTAAVHAAAACNAPVDRVTVEVVHLPCSGHSLRSEPRDGPWSGDLPLSPLLRPAASHAADGGVIRRLLPGGRVCET